MNQDLLTKWKEYREWLSQVNQEKEIAAINLQRENKYVEDLAAYAKLPWYKKLFRSEPKIPRPLMGNALLPSYEGFLDWLADEKI